MAWADYDVVNSLQGFVLNSKYKEDSIACGWREALILAINEKCDVTGTTKPYTTMPKLNDARVVTIDLQNKVNELIPKFVNHTNNGGNWDGQTSIPMWTKADMLTHLGEAEIVYSYLSANVSEWALQQYRLLNLMRWVNENASIARAPEIENPCRAMRNESTTWLTTTNQFNSESWNTFNHYFAVYSLFLTGTQDIGHLGYISSGTPAIRQITRTRGYLNKVNSNLFKVSCDFYPLFEIYEEPGNFYDADYNSAEDKLKLLAQKDFNLSETYKFWVGDLTDSTILEPILPNEYLSWRVLKSNLVCKYNVTGGFTFQDNTI